MFPKQSFPLYQQRMRQRCTRLVHGILEASHSVQDSCRPQLHGWEYSGSCFQFRKRSIVVLGLFWQIKKLPAWQHLCQQSILPSFHDPCDVHHWHAETDAFQFLLGSTVRCKKGLSDQMVCLTRWVQDSLSISCIYLPSFQWQSFQYLSRQEFKQFYPFLIYPEKTRPDFEHQCRGPDLSPAAFSPSFSSGSFQAIWNNYMHPTTSS